MIYANIDLGSWDVIHQGISLKTGFTMGQISISVGSIRTVIELTVLIIGWLLGCSVESKLL